MPQVPREPRIDRGLPLPREGRPSMGRRGERPDSDPFEIRLLLDKSVCISGAKAAKAHSVPRCDAVLPRGALS